MKVSDAIKQLSEMPPDLDVVVSSMAEGGLVFVTKLELVTSTTTDKEQWVEVLY